MKGKEYEYWNAFPAGASIAPGDVSDVIAHGSADPAILAEADMTFNYLSNGDDGFILVKGSEDTLSKSTPSVTGEAIPVQVGKWLV